MPHTAIIVAAGASRRMGFDKLATKIAGKPVLQHTVENFLNSDLFSEIIIVGHEERFALLRGTSHFDQLIRVDGGAERYLSVANGIHAASAESTHISVHDAARPFISIKDLIATLEAAKAHGAACLARRVTETLNRSDTSDFITQPVTRDHLWVMETPQIFEANLLRTAYRHISEKNIPVTDETSAIQSIGERVKLIPSTSPNPKITTPADLVFAEHLCSQN